MNLTLNTSNTFNVIAFCIFPFISGCHLVPTSTNTDLAEAIISQNVSIAVEAQKDYLSILKEDSRIHNQRIEDFDNELVDIDYIGKPLPILNAMGRRYGFKIVEIGKRKDLRIINMRMKNVSPTEILRNLSHQVDYAADIILDKNSNSIRLVYK